MYSSFKKQKLLTESWRKFLKEASEEETSYFGNWIDENYLNQFSMAVSKAFKEKQFDILNKQKTLKYIAHGTFRAVYQPENDKDYIIKFAINQSGFGMNKSEFDIQLKSDLFPKVFKHAEDFSWIVTESLGVNDSEKFNTFFPRINDVLSKLGYVSSEINLYISGCMLTNKSTPPGEDNCFYKIAERAMSFMPDVQNNFGFFKSKAFKDNIFIPSVYEALKDPELNMDVKNDLPLIKKALEEGELIFLSKLVKKIPKLTEITTAKMNEYFKTDPNTIKLLRAIKELKIDPTEIVPRNTGYNKAGKFKIIDASLEKDFSN